MIIEDKAIKEIFDKNIIKIYYNSFDLGSKCIAYAKILHYYEKHNIRKYNELKSDLNDYDSMVKIILKEEK